MAITKPTSRKAKHGEKMIEVKVRFWTNDLGDPPGTIRPRHGWTSGVVRMKRNESHGITPGEPIMFNSLMQLPASIEELLLREGVTLHRDHHMKHYVR